MRIITLGTFDLVHIGHLKLLNKCARLGCVTIGLNTDEFIEKYKGNPPIMTYGERLSTLRMVCDCQILPNSQEDGSAKGVILKSKAELIVIGSDWARKDYVGQLGLDWDWLDDNGIGICYLNYTKDISTTKIKERILS